MVKKTKGSTRKARKRELNVIYFVDSARTRSFKMPLTRLNFLLGCLSLVLLWSIASVLLLVLAVNDRQKVAGKLVTSLETIFDYETRFDNVFEIAYPSDPSLLAGIASKEAVPEDAAEKKDDVLPPPRPAPPPKASPPPVAENPTKPKKQSITIASPIVEQGAKSFELQFTIQNAQPPKRIEGYVWAVAEFQPKVGSSIFVGAPSGIKVTNAGVVTYPQRAYRFSIRRFKKKRFTFAYPSGQNGRFTKIRIGVQDKRSDASNIYNVPVDIAVGSENAQDKGEASGKKQGAIRLPHPMASFADVSKRHN